MKVGDIYMRVDNGTFDHHHNQAGDLVEIVKIEEGEDFIHVKWNYIPRIHTFCSVQGYDNGCNGVQFSQIYVEYEVEVARRILSSYDL
jgi:hypothetical protein